MPLSALESGLCVTGVPRGQQRRMRKLTILVAVLDSAMNRPEAKVRESCAKLSLGDSRAVLAFAYVVVLGAESGCAAKLRSSSGLSRNFGHRPSCGR
jgi:hypothetical protein